ncbi:thiamine pyrophosphokinase [Collybia nuda]|uniref:Thiamine pyrophosphokinase n=1 Tax=Collybia nuda TaxID=64659 RepID=A0A9P5YHX2_9AGAR|nr:thiamine pyrophosphokinase [Collybia nuda]
MKTWDVGFLRANPPDSQRALIILNQPFCPGLLRRLWNSCAWRCCADGGANRLYDLFSAPDFVDCGTSRARSRYLPDLIKGDLDSIREDVRAYYTSLGVPVIKDEDQDSTDLMKCVFEIQKREQSEQSQQEIILLGGLSGRLDQTIHTLSYLHKLHTTRPYVFAVTDDNVAWVLGAVPGPCS